jgi:predicted NBD/HSP70 family sugar kinase
MPMTQAPLIAAGLDLGGTKIEAQVFDFSFNRVTFRRIPTPQTYDALVAAVADQIAWVESQSPGLPLGIAAAGLIHPVTGLALTANLPASGKAFPADIALAAGRAVTYLNDCRAQALSEAQFGAAKGYPSALCLNLGTGIAGGFVVGGALAPSALGLGGEYGHFALPAHVVQAHALPIITCGCGRSACMETLISGPGLARITEHRTGRSLTAQQIVALRGNDEAIAQCWAIWCELAAELIHTLCLTLDPACIVLAGGLSQAQNLVDDLTKAATQAALRGYAPPPILLAQGGDATAARGAAYAAFLERGRE